jgi:small subunit ribosomal protein S16
MSVRVRLTRVGSKKNPIWRVVVADQRSPRDGRFIEALGHYNPQTQPSTVVLDRERLQHWIDLGAEPTNTVRKLMRTENTAHEAVAEEAAAVVEARTAEAIAQRAAATEAAAEADAGEPAADSQEAAPEPAPEGESEADPISGVGAAEEPGADAPATGDATEDAPADPPEDAPADPSEDAPADPPEGDDQPA